MDILAQRKSMGNLSGFLLVDGQPATSSFIRKTAYVPQVCCYSYCIGLLVLCRVSVWGMKCVDSVAMWGRRGLYGGGGGGTAGRRWGKLWLTCRA